MPTIKSGVTTAEASVSATESGVAPATTAVASTAMLRPRGHREEERERRDGRQATHTDAIISPFLECGRSFTIRDEDAEATAGPRLTSFP